MKTQLKLLILLFGIFAFSCSKTETSPDSSAAFVDKWWCDVNGKLSSQYFKSDGTWEQGSKGGTLNDKGNWALSSDKKKILITNVVGKYQTQKSWEYELTSSSETNLELNYKAFSIKMTMTVCK